VKDGSMEEETARRNGKGQNPCVFAHALFNVVVDVDQASLKHIHQ
jgi:hypothetical protein